jgi:serine/threonine protein kinase
VVVAAKDKKAKDPENDLVAIKKIEKAFEHKVFTKRTVRELKMLRLLAHENVLFPIFSLNLKFLGDWN